MRTASATGNKGLNLATRASLLATMTFAGFHAPFSHRQTTSGAAKSSDRVTSPIQFDVVSVKMHNPDTQGSRMQLLPDGIRLSNLPLQDLIVQSFDLALSDQIVGLPSWANSPRFDIEAKVADSDIAAFHKLNLEQVRSMGRMILADRFKFASHEESRNFPFYALAVAKDGSKLKPSTVSDQDSNARTGIIGMRHASSESGGINQLTANGVTMDRLASTLSQQGLGRVVLDNTNLTGRYDFQLTWASQTTAADANSRDVSGPSIFTAVSEQLGLRLEPRKGPIPVLVIDHIEAPSLN
jgi:uncharacterized protein (TIGR03435 family)